jgi:hypothetical protein
MRRFRFHLGTLVILVLLFAVGFAALRESNETWDSGVISLTLGLLLISILFAIHRTNKSRAFWLGFALLGSSYLGLSLVPSIESRLITNRALALLHSKMPRSSPRSVVLYHLLVGNNSKPDAFFLNNSNGTFEDVKAMAGVNPVSVVIVLGTTLATRRVPPVSRW